MKILLIALSAVYVGFSIWTSLYWSTEQNMNWVYPLLSGVLAGNIVYLLVWYVWVSRRPIKLALAFFMAWSLLVTLVLSGSTGENPQLSFSAWRPVIVFGRQMMVLGGAWTIYAFRVETFGRYG